MYVISARNVSDALVQGMQVIKTTGAKRDSRNGPVLTMDTPVTTIYARPKERVIFFPERDANPFFHFMEGLWMLSGRDDVEWISRFNDNIANYSDDGVTFHGAYGYRWRHHFNGTFVEGGAPVVGRIDQLETVANLLIRNPEDRRIVLQMWDPVADLGMNGKDFPCNLCITFRVNPYGELDMTVFNRSNDMIWGAYGANAVHMSMLQEVMASWIKKPVGRYWQISTNFHAYLATFEKHQALLKFCPGFSEYEVEGVETFPMVNISIDEWFQDLHMFMEEGPVLGFRDPFFKRVVLPIWNAWRHWKNKDNPMRYVKAMETLEQCAAPDWKRACIEWIERRV